MSSCAAADFMMRRTILLPNPLVLSLFSFLAGAPTPDRMELERAARVFSNEYTFAYTTDPKLGRR